MSTETLKLTVTCAGPDDLALQTVSRSASYSRPTTLAGCYTSRNQVAIAFGCEDGSIFSFVSPATPTQIDCHKTPSIRVPSEAQIAATRKRAPLSAPHPRRAASPESATHRPLSPSALSISAFSNQSSSGTHTPNPLALPSRSRPTQPGISRASIEAPKARVDVGDEQGKLRALLAKGSGGKARRVSLGSVDSTDGRGSDRLERKAGDALRGPMSLAMSVVDIAFGGVGIGAPAAPGSAPALSIVGDDSEDETTSEVLSPTFSESTLAGAAIIKTGVDVGQIKLQLQNHILPGRGGAWEAVTGLEVVGDQDMYICLQSSGTLSLLSLLDGYCLASIHADDLPRLNPPHGYRSADSVSGSWEWVSLSLVPYVESMIVMIAARPHSESISTRVIHSRVAVYKIPEFDPEAAPDPIIALEKVGEWFLEAEARTISFVAGYNGLMFTYLNAQGHVVLAPLNMLPPPPEPEFEHTPKPEPAAPAQSIGMIPIPNPFKAFKPRETVKSLIKPQNRDGRLLAGTEKDAGMCWNWAEADEGDETVNGMKVCGEGHGGSDVLALIWTDMRVLLRSDVVKAYVAEMGRDDLSQCCEIPADDAVDAHFTSNKGFMVLRQSGSETYRLRKTDPNGDPASALGDTLYLQVSPSHSSTFEAKAQTVTAIPLLGQLCIVTTGRSTPESGLVIAVRNVDRDAKRIERIWEGQNATSGPVEATAVLPVDPNSIFAARSDGRLYRVPLSELVSDPAPQAAENTLDARVTKLWFVTEEWSKELFLLGALNDGGVACWNARSLQLVARWTIFTSEVELILSLSIGDDRLGRLKGCVMAVAADGTIAVIVLDGLSLLCVIPGSPALLDRICVGGDNLLLFYSHGLARLWDMKTHEFWRSMQQSKGEELLDQGGWFEVPVGRWEAPRPIHTLGALQNNVSCPDAAATLIMDISSIVELAKDEAAREQLEQVLAAVAPCGVDADVDVSCRVAFKGGEYGKVAMGLINERFGASSIVVSGDPAGVWKVSPRYTALRLLGVVSLLRSALSLEDEVRQAARTIFESRLAQMSDAEVVNYVTDIAKSVALYLHDEAQASNTSPANRILSIELCSRGFQVWQHHVDAMEMLRALSGFAVASPGGSKGGKEARAAILQIAASSTPLFMTTLSLDITQPKTVEHRRATMQLVAFIIRKKPLVLYPNLPRLVEAVVKSLDPSSSGRDAIMDAATEILAEVVRIYPSVDFHMATQKLAVGTPEGAVIVYDLKTATRLYVLEGHSRRLTVLSFSPDGRRLATASLEESVVMVWKVGTSFATWFTPGAPPRQGHGHGTSEPFKRLDFNVGDEAHMTVAATLEWVAFSWPADRTARLSIRDSVLTFAC
ncbi:hypothetical protein FRC10_011973 [Ceratobasidium sp. 414]|nr:hypothetical protein FRC10_011973 [Ceratobasidium sp. 414]